MTTTTTLQVLFLITITITCLFNTVPVLSQERCDPRDKRVLIQILKEFNSQTLRKAWDTRKDCCQWYNIACDLKSNRVYYVDFTGGLDLSRPTPIPPSFTQLPYLRVLNFYNVTNLIGPIPPSLVHLKSLERLTIRGTNVSDPIPHFLSQLTRLNYLDLSDSHFSGPIPASLGSLKNMQVINLGGNRLNGPIPESLGSFSNLAYLYLNHNQLSGKIPASFAKLNVGTVDLSWNRLEGDASMLFGSNKKTTVLALSGNKLAFDLGKVELPTQLQWFLIDHNSIYGTLPKGLTQLKSLDKLNVSYNNLCGQIPQGGNLQKFKPSSYAHNKCLCGRPLPPCRK